MSGVFSIIVVFVFCNLLLLTDFSSSHPLCTNMRSPFTPKAPLTFCQYNGSVCCNSTEDMQLQNLFKTMDVSDLGCASLVKLILCSRCDQFSAELYRIESVPRKVPILCNSTVSPNSRQYQPGGVDFCSKVWDECQNVSLLNSPFSMQVRGGTPSNSTSKLSDIWQSKNDFCNTFGGSSESELFCFDGGPVLLNNSEIPTPPSGMCLEKIGNGSYLNMVAHPDGSNRVFLSDQPGKVWMATVPEEGSGEMLVKWPECSGRCSCNSDVGCDPSKLGSDNGAQPCQYHSIIAEFTANGTTSQPSSVTSVKPLEVRRIFTMGLPFTSHHAGQILFGPKDGFLYFMMGDGGSKGDPYNFSQNKKSLLGKIMRLDIDNLPSAMTITDLGLWGNYSVPGDNPFSEDKELQPEIWALGFRNPWRCSFDLERPSYFLCADVGQVRDSN
ncbi:HIPL1 protein [Prunus yedoensis var. nudiflora]|uniref:HIPL1 protein n=1 Tax=Prunus yedoensis var. nudiflora TaxID=2094558 RepID=A0A314YGR5_PRUYE|nr:HIPL1 protein [Prunus yedoensis var. nudiflora]